MKRFSNLERVLALALIIVLIVLAAIVQRQGALTSDLNKALDDLEKTNAQQQLMYNEIDYQAQLLNLVGAPTDDRLYLPELRLSLPRNDVTLSLKYSYNQGIANDNSGDVRLTSAYMTDHQSHRMSCSDMVRLNIQDKINAYSPSQPHAATVKLADGRSLQIYASNSKECDRGWRVVSPATIADEFKKAVSY